MFHSSNFQNADVHDCCKTGLQKVILSNSYKFTENKDRVQSEKNKDR